MAKPPRIWVSNAKPARGEIVRVRAQIEHQMESGSRSDEAGRLRPRNIVRKFGGPARAEPASPPGNRDQHRPEPLYRAHLRRPESASWRMAEHEKDPPLEARKTITLS